MYQTKNKNIISYTIFTVLILILTFITSLSLSSNPYSEFLPAHDSSMFQYFGFAMSKGQTLYTEIFDHKGPMIFILNWLGTVLSFGNIKGIYFIEFFSLFIYFTYSFKTFTNFINKYLAFILLIPQGLILMDFMERGNLTEIYALPFIGISLYIFTKYFISGVKQYEIIILGISCALVFSLRANMVVLWLVFALIIFIEKLVKNDYKTLINYVLLFLGGLLITFVLISIYLLIQGAFQEGVYQSLIFNFLYLDQTNDKEEAIRILYTLLSNNFLILPPAIFSIYTAAKWKELDNNKRMFYVGIVLFAISSYLSSTLSGRAYRHYLIAMVPTVTLPLAILFKQFSENNKLAVTLLSLISLYVVFYIQIENRYDALIVENIANVEAIETNDRVKHLVEVNKDSKRQTIEVADIIKKHTTPEDRIYVHRKAGNIYLLSDRLSSIRYFNLPAININENTEIGEDFMNEIKTSDTKIIVLDSSYNDASKEGVDKDFFEYILENYELLQNINGYCVYKKKIDY